MTLKKNAVALLALAFVALTGCGENGADSSKGSAGRVVEVKMTDNAFDPNSLSVAAGETITFKFTNEGSLTHDAFIGDAEAQEEHGDSMASGDGMAGHNMDDGDALLLEPDDTGELTHTFDETGDVLIGCHQPGHYEAGMKSTVTVS